METNISQINRKSNGDLKKINGSEDHSSISRKYNQRQTDGNQDLLNIYEAFNENRSKIH